MLSYSDVSVIQMENAVLISIRVPKEMGDRLNALSKKTERTKSYFILKALDQYMEDMEDIFESMYRIENPLRRNYTQKEVDEELGLAD